MKKLVHTLSNFVRSRNCYIRFHMNCFSIQLRTYSYALRAQAGVQVLNKKISAMQKRPIGPKLEQRDKNSDLWSARKKHRVTWTRHFFRSKSSCRASRCCFLPFLGRLVCSSTPADLLFLTVGEKIPKPIHFSGKSFRFSLSRNLENSRYQFSKRTDQWVKSADSCFFLHCPMLQLSFSG